MSSLSPSARRVIAVLLAASASCTGVIDDEAAGGGSSPGRPAGTRPATGSGAGALAGAVAGPGTQPSAGSGLPGSTAGPGSPAGTPAAALASRPRAPLRRLSRAQYNNTIRDLLSDTSRPADAFLKEEVPGAFSGSELSTQAPPVVIDQYRNAAELLAASAVTRLSTLVPCQPQPSEEACARTFIEAFGVRAFRRPLGPEETSALLEVFRKARLDGDFVWGIQTVMGSILMAPSFLYRVELPPANAAPGTLASLDSYAVASRLSYFLWNTMPDAELFAAAKAAKLTTPADIEAQVLRMLKDPKAREAGAEFFTQWLGLTALDGKEKNTKMFPELTDALRAAMQEETRRFGLWVMFDGDGRLETLLTASKSMVNSALGKLYGVTAPSAYGMVDLKPSERSGVLTQASIMTLTAGRDTTSSTIRGKFVLDQFVCQEPPPPPPDLDFTLPAVKPGQTARERFAEHTKNATCAACHSFIDPVGFAFENYDAIGKFQTLDNGKPIDASGNFSNTRDLNGAFDGAIALTKKLAGSNQVRECLLRKWFTFAMGRMDEMGDQASVATATQGLGTAPTIRDVVVALAKSDSFRTRLVEAPR